MNLVPSTPIHVQHDKYELIPQNASYDHILFKFLFISNVFFGKSMKTELLVAVLKLFLKLLLWDIFLEILKWKLVSEILNVTRDM
jgi:hypothetical protein